MVEHDKPYHYAYIRKYLFKIIYSRCNVADECGSIDHEQIALWSLSSKSQDFFCNSEAKASQLSSSML